MSLWFALIGTVMRAKQESDKRRLIPVFIILFIISGTAISIMTELLRNPVFGAIEPTVQKLLSPGYASGFRLIFDLLTDSIAYVIPCLLFARLVKERLHVGITIYMLFVIVDRLALILAVSAFSYFIITVAILLLGLIATPRKDREFIMQHSSRADWSPVFHYQLGLFFLLHVLYDANLVFPVKPGVYDLVNLWIDLLAFVSFAFFFGFAKLNIKAVKEQAEKIEYMEKLQEGERDIIQKFAEISEAKSGETGQHVRRVAEYSYLLSKEYGLSEDECDHIRIASMMHDIGKILVPREILEKPGPLNDEEWKIMCQHTTYGDDVLANSMGEVISMARDIAYQHHERWDGTGYPQGLSGDDISVYARIVAVADVYDALTSKRAYKEAWDIGRARAEIESQSGKQFSPRVVSIFSKCFDEIRRIQETYVDPEET